MELIPSSYVLPTKSTVIITKQITIDIVDQRIILKPRSFLENKWPFDMETVGEERVEMALQIEDFKGGPLNKPTY